MTKMKDLILALSVLYISGQVQCDVINSPCDDGWISDGKKCYLINNVKSVSRAAAEAECLYHDSSLLDVQSADIMNFLVQSFNQYPSSGYWTDLNDISDNVLLKSGTGIWKWGHFMVAEMSLISWNMSPANDGQSNCAGINIQGKMEDLDCNSRQRFICKIGGLADEGCPLGWLISTNNCYYVSSLRKLKTWEQAKTYCESMSIPSYDSKLLVIANKEDKVFLTSELPYLPSTTHVYWTGLQNVAGSWGWYTQEYLDQTLLQWQAEPDNVAGEENCGVLRMNGKFSDRNCSSKANFICDKPQYSYNVSNDVGCGSWIRAGRFCYGFITGKHAGTWASARSYCQSMGADLIKVDSTDKKAWLEVQMMQPSNDKLFWTGLNDKEVEATYVWADGTPANASHIKWNQEPNNYKGQENCAVIYSTGQYNDVPCITYANAICEIDNFVKGPCPAGWLRNGKNCYFFTDFIKVSLLFNQLEAADYCQGVGGTLLSVNDANERDYIKHMVKNTLQNNIYGWWTSLNDKQHEGIWTFSSGLQTDPALVQWIGEPSTTEGDNCGLITYAGHYYQRNCNSEINFICEKLAKGSSNEKATWRFDKSEETCHDFLINPVFGFVV